VQELDSVPDELDQLVIMEALGDKQLKIRAESRGKESAFIKPDHGRGCCHIGDSFVPSLWGLVIQMRLNYLDGIDGMKATGDFTQRLGVRRPPVGVASEGRHRHLDATRKQLTRDSLFGFHAV